MCIITNNHQVLTRQGWKKAEDLKKCDVLIGMKHLKGPLDDRLKSFKIIKCADEEDISDKK